MTNKQLPFYALSKDNYKNYKFSELDENIHLYILHENNTVYKYEIKEKKLINPKGEEVALNYVNFNWFRKFIKT